MSRTMHDANLHTRAARTRLRQQRKPHWCTLRPGALHLGYSRPKRGKPGIWTVRTYAGNVKTLAPGKRGGCTPYRVARLPGVADDYEDANGATVLSFAQAQDLALAPPATAQPAGGPLTVEGAIADYVSFVRDSGRERAGADAEGRMRMHVPPQLGGVRVADLTPQQLRGWLADLAKKLQRWRPSGDDAERRSRVSANRIFTTLRAALNHAFADGKVPSDAWRRRVKPFKNVNVARERYLTVEECRRLINGAQGTFRALVHAALHTGARYGELTRLRVSDFDEDSGTVRVGQSKPGKPRHVHLTDEGEAFFQELTAGRHGDEPMLRRDDGQPWGRSDQQWRMRHAVERASIAPTISFHGLRHSYASLSIMNGVPLNVVAENLGHVDTRMCEHHYGHLAESHKRDAIRAGAPRFGVAGAGRVRPLRQR